MINQDAQLKLQAYLDGELPDREAAEVKAWLERDQDAQLLLTELKNTSAALSGFEAAIKLPESREFFWSKIEREIQQQAQAASRPSVSWWQMLRQQLAPLTAIAVLMVSLTVFVVHSGRAGGTPFGEMEVASDEMGAYTFRDQSAKMTMVWYYDRTDDSQFTDSAPFASVDPQ